MKKVLGKIASVDICSGGYQSAQLVFRIGMDAGGHKYYYTVDGHWLRDRTERDEWTEASRFLKNGEMLCELRQLLCAAKTGSMRNLVGIPVEITLDDYDSLISYRVLKEVL